MNHGQNTQSGFLAGIPSMDELLKRVGLTDNFAPTDAIPLEKNPAQEVREELLKAYVRVFQTDDGKKVLEDLLNKSLRCGFVKNDEHQTIESVALYAKMRGGQNGIVISILKMIVDGQALGKKPTAKTRKRK